MGYIIKIKWLFNDTFMVQKLISITTTHSCHHSHHSQFTKIKVNKQTKFNLNSMPWKRWSANCIKVVIIILWKRASSIYIIICTIIIIIIISTFDIPRYTSYKILHCLDFFYLNNPLKVLYPVHVQMKYKFILSNIEHTDIHFYIPKSSIH